MLTNTSKRSNSRPKPILPPDEARRLATLYFLEVLDTPHQDQFDRIARMAQRLFAVPIATVSFIDADREWMKSAIGLELGELAREISFASHAILERDPLIVPDTSLDLRFFDSPLVRGEAGIRFYAGVPLQAWNGVNIGALSIMDTTPRSLTEHELVALRDLAAAVEHEIGAGELKLVDQLTGLMNQRGLTLIANHIVPRASRDGEAMSMLFIDVEGLDEVNSRYGRSAGDAILLTITDVLRETLRGADVPARMRGDDFAILLPDTEVGEVEIVISRIRRQLEERVSRRFLPTNFGIRISRATIDPSIDDFTLESLIALADTGT
jgi:diguanylate cyclase (GGDEF)-like protein